MNSQGRGSAPMRLNLATYAAVSRPSSHGAIEQQRAAMLSLQAARTAGVLRRLCAGSKLDDVDRAELRGFRDLFVSLQSALRFEPGTTGAPPDYPYGLRRLVSAKAVLSAIGEETDESKDPDTTASILNRLIRSLDALPIDQPTETEKAPASRSQKVGPKQEPAAVSRARPQAEKGKPSLLTAQQLLAFFEGVSHLVRQQAAMPGERVVRG